MATEMEFVKYKEFVAGLSETESLTSTDKVVVSNPTNGPRSMPGSAKDRSTTINAFREGDTIPVDGVPLAKMPYEDLLRLAAENALGSIATAFVPNSTNAVANNLYSYGGHFYVAKQDYNGAWDSSKFAAISVENILRIVAVGHTTSLNYKAGQFVQNQKDLYQFNYDKSAGAFDLSKVSKISVTTALTELFSFVDWMLAFENDNSSFAKTTGKAIATNGTEYSPTGYNYYSKSVSEGEVYDLKSWCSLYYVLWLLLDANGNVIDHAEGFNTALREEIVVIPQNAATLIVNSAGDFSAKIKKATLSSSACATDGSDFLLCRNSSGKMEPVNTLRELGLSSKMVTDLPNGWTCVNGYAILEGNINNPIANAQYSYYEKDGVSEGDVYKIKARTYANYYLYQVYDINGNRLTQSVGPNPIDWKEETITLPKGSYKLVINHNTGYGTSGLIIERLIQEIKPQTKDKMYGKTLVCCGDSITFGADMPADGIAFASSIDYYIRNSAKTAFIKYVRNVVMPYGYIIAARHNMVFYNEGVSGSTVEDIEGKYGFSKADGRYTTLPDDIDYLTLWFGVNDSAYGTLGTISDNTNTTFYGAYNIVLSYLINKYPYTKICLIVPFGTNSNMRQAVRELGSKWGLAVFDMFGAGTPLYYEKESSVGVEASIVAANRAKFQANGAHPNYQGHTQIADMLEDFLLSI